MGSSDQITCSSEASNVYVRKHVTFSISSEVMNFDQDKIGRIGI